jgi:hypothetical protein
MAVGITALLASVQLCHMMDMAGRNVKTAPPIINQEDTDLQI